LKQELWWGSGKEGDGKEKGFPYHNSAKGKKPITNQTKPVWSRKTGESTRQRKQVNQIVKVQIGNAKKLLKGLNEYVVTFINIDVVTEEDWGGTKWMGPFPRCGV